MEPNSDNPFNNRMRERTMNMAAGIFELFSARKITILQRPIVIQLIKSSSSVAANYRAATRARSDAEYYAKICIVVEECDESQFWLDFLIRTRVITLEEIYEIYRETIELVKIFTTIKRKVKDRLEGKQANGKTTKQENGKTVKR